MLLSIYATNFSTTSPIIFDWREENVYNMLGCDQELIEAFCLVKAEMFWLRQQKLASKKAYKLIYYRCG
jgi:hypothetical protein